MTGSRKQVQRVAAYGVVRDGAGRILLVRASDRSTVPGMWFLPGGGVEHGEHPEATVVREFEEETGLTIETEHLLGVESDVVELDQMGESLHQMRLIYAVRLVGGSLRGEKDGSSDLVRWLGVAQLDRLPLAGFVSRVLDASPLSPG